MTTYTSFILHANAVNEDEDIVAQKEAAIKAAEEKFAVRPLVLRRAGSTILGRYFVGKGGAMKKMLEADLRYCTIWVPPVVLKYNDLDRIVYFL